MGGHRRDDRLTLFRERERALEARIAALEQEIAALRREQALDALNLRLEADEVYYRDLLERQQSRILELERLLAGTSGDGGPGEPPEVILPNTERP